VPKNLDRAFNAVIAGLLDTFLSIRADSRKSAGNNLNRLI